MAAPSRLTLEAVAYLFVAPLGEGPRLALIRTLLPNYCAMVYIYHWVYSMNLYTFTHPFNSLH